MHVLIVPSYYPTATAPGNGVFVREQVSALTQAGVTVGIIIPTCGSSASCAGVPCRSPTCRWSRTSPPGPRG